MTREIMSDRWRGYYDATMDKPPRHTIIAALTAFEREGVAPGLALDLGCGAGRDMWPMLARGWRAVGIDPTEEGLQRLRERLAEADRHKVELRATPLEEAALVPATLVNASFVLPFLEKAAFHAVWRKIHAALEPGGRFAGQLFGPEDSWVARGTCHGHSRAELDLLLTPYTIELLEEEEHDGITARGTAKHWHIWHLVLRKPAR